MSEENGIIDAYVFTGSGRSEAIADWQDVNRRWHGPDPVWLHLHLGNAQARRWLEAESGLDPIVAAALAAEEPRPRCDGFGEGLIVALRGVNLNPGAEPDDMVSIRLWVDERHAVSVRRRKLMAIDDLRDEIARGQAPASAAGFLAMLAARIVDRMAPVLSDLDDRVDELEDMLLTAPGHEVRAKLGAIRREAIALRRYIAPQREAMARLAMHAPAWIGLGDRNRLREVADNITRCVEDLDTVRERAAVVQDEVGNRLSEQINRNMYLLSLVAALFLPLGFVTGLLGINVGGIPGEGLPYAFLEVCGILAVLAAAEFWLFRKLKWL
jgi:zinc transporter